MKYDQHNRNKKGNIFLKISLAWFARFNICDPLILFQYSIFELSRWLHLMAKADYKRRRSVTSRTNLPLFAFPSMRLEIHPW